MIDRNIRNIEYNFYFCKKEVRFEWNFYCFYNTVCFQNSLRVPGQGRMPAHVLSRVYVRILVYIIIHAHWKMDYIIDKNYNRYQN